MYWGQTGWKLWKVALVSEFVSLENYNSFFKMKSEKSASPENDPEINNKSLLDCGDTRLVRGLFAEFILK